MILEVYLPGLIVNKTLICIHILEEIVSLVITLMAAPRLIKVCGTMVPLMCTYTTRLPGSKYYGQITFPSIKSYNCPMTLMVGASLLHLHGS